MQPKRKVVKNLPEYEKLIARIRDVRQTYGSSQADVAAGMNLSRSQYTALETGRSMLTYDQLVSLSKYYGMTVTSLLSGVS